MFSKLRKRLASKKNEEGAGFVGLIGISLLVTITASSVVASATFGTFTTNTRLAQQQAQDAAEAGVADAIASISTGNCQAVMKSTRYGYTAEVYRSSSGAPPTASDVAEKNLDVISKGCPIDGDKWVMIESSGNGQKDTVHFDTKSEIIAVYKWQDVDVAVIPQAVAGLHVTFNGSKINSSPGVVGSPIVLTDGGSFKCTNSSQVNANMKIKKYKSTSYTSDFANCLFNGDLVSSEKVVLNTATINGEVCGPTGSSVSLDDSVKQNHQLSNSECVVDGALYGYSPAEGMFKTEIVLSHQCSSLTNLKDYIESRTEPTILDFDKNCSAEAKGLLNTSTIKTLELKTDITYLAKEWNALNLTISSKTGDPVNFNFVSKNAFESPNSIQPNYTTNRASKVKYTNGASGILYSAGTVRVELDSAITGQVVGGYAVQIVNSTLNHLPITLPGITKNVSTNDTIKPLIRVY